MVTDTTHFPLVDLRPVSNSAHQWVALSARLTADQAEAGDDSDTPAPSPWHAVFDSADLLSAIAPLDCIVHLPSPAVLSAPLLDELPANRVLFAVDAATLREEGALAQLSQLQESGYRVLLDGATRTGVKAPATLSAVAHDCADALAAGRPLAALFGPHLAHGVDTPELFAACGAAGFAWFSGAYARQATRPGSNSTAANSVTNSGTKSPAGTPADPDDGITARRLLKLLGLLLADADTRDIELQLRQDPSLCYHLLRLVNSAAFAPAAPIHNFAQAIDRLGRRQLLRWLQLLLYARPRADGLANPLLPLAAMRAAQIESLCKQNGCERDAQDLSFQVGVFSLLDVLLGMPMAEIVSALSLPPDSAGALLQRSGVVGGYLALVEAVAPSPAALGRAGVSRQQWWHSQLHGYHWAIQVSRNL